MTAAAEDPRFGHLHQSQVLFLADSAAVNAVQLQDFLDQMEVRTPVGVNANVNVLVLVRVLAGPASAPRLVSVSIPNVSTAIAGDTDCVLHLDRRQLC